MPIEPFANQTFRCPYCGSGRGPACSCQFDKLKKDNFKLDLPKLPRNDIFNKKPWESNWK